MALTARSRSALYQGLTDLIEDEVAVGELLSYFPARDVEEPATKEFVAAQIAEVRREASDFRADVATQFADVRRDVSAFRAEVAAELGDIRAEMAAMEARLTAQANAQMRASIQWTIGALISVMGLVIAMGFLRPA